MSAQPETLGHPFASSGAHDVFEAVAGVPIHESLDAATDRLEAVVVGLRELMAEPSVSNQATLIYFAADAALALCYADEGGQPFAIWPKPAVTQRFDRFVTECAYETAERATHPEVPQGRFKIHPRQIP